MGCVLHYFQSLLYGILLSWLRGLILILDWLVYSVECLNITTTDCYLYKGLFWVSSLGGVHQFISHWFIPLDPFEQRSKLVQKLS